MSAPETIELLSARYGRHYRALTTAAVVIGMASAVVTTTIVNVAIPEIMGAFGMGLDVAHWLSTGALAGAAVAMLVQAWVVRRFGPRRTFLVVLALMAAALTVAGIAPNEFVLILARVVQGAVAGVLQPLAIYMLYRVFPANRRGQAMGIFGLIAILGPALGPTIGGITMEHFNWRYIFFVALPPTLLAMLLGVFILPERVPEDEATAPQQPFDWIALVLVSSSVLCLLVALSEGPAQGWTSDRILILVTAGVASGAACIIRELRSDSPLVDVRPLAVPAFAAAAAVAWIYGAALFALIYLIPLFVQTVQGFTPLQAGLLVMPSGLVLAVAMPVSGALADRMAPRGLIIAGILVTIASTFWMAGVDVDTPFVIFGAWIAVGRVGLALVNPALNMAALAALPAHYLGQGAGLVNFARQIGGAFGVNLLATWMDRRHSVYLDALLAAQSGSVAAASDALRELRDLLARGGASLDLQLEGAQLLLAQVVAAQAHALAFRDCFAAIGIAFVVSLAPAYFAGRAAR